MKYLLVILLAVSLIFGIELAFADKGTFVDKIEFIQYLDENTALEEVKNGNLDLYYYRIPSERIENAQLREGLQVFESTGGSYSILLNPAVSEKFNPFSLKDVRFALNYLVDRKLIVNELMGGYGTPMISNYGPFDPDYLYILNELESFNFRYNPALADEMITNALTDAGAIKNNGKWMYDGNQIEITALIRSDDPVRKSIGELVTSELEKLGFAIKKDFGDLNKAFVVVYGSDPGELKWNLYTEGWGGRSAFVKYDSVGLGQMYSPWFSNMPGFNDPTNWNYQNDKMDSMTQEIYTGGFGSTEERIELIQHATVMGVEESVRIFLASKIDQYVANERVDGVINDFGAGVPTRFTPINARVDSGSLVVGVKQIYQGAWNPIMGLNDVYSRHIWNTLYDPGTFKHPYTGETFPVRANWVVDTAGSGNTMDVPSDAMIWDIESQSWRSVGDGVSSISKVTYDLTFGNWHHGERMDMNDILYSLYFTLEWGSEQQENDKTFDSEYTPQQAQTAKTIVAVRVIDDDTIEVYVDYWHFDEAEIAAWGDIWSVMPWEILSAMEEAVIDGKLSYSRSGAANKNVNWLSLIVPNDSTIVQHYLEDFSNSNYVPVALQSGASDGHYFESRYHSAIDWIDEKRHAVISNGPFFLERYSPESRTILINAFADSEYPFQPGHWEEFERAKFPQIMDVDLPLIIKQGTSLSIPISVVGTTSIEYFLTNSDGQIVASGTKSVQNDSVELLITDKQTSQLNVGANDLKIFAVSATVLRPDVFTTSFLVSAENEELPKTNISNVQSFEEADSNYGIVLAIIGIIIVGIIFYYRKRSKNVISKSNF